MIRITRKRYNKARNQEDVSAMRFLVLFHGGNIPEDKKEQSIQDRLTWMNELRGKDYFIDGSPVTSDGKLITGSVTSDFTHGSDSTNGYALIEAETVEMAVELVQAAPQLKAEYGGAAAEIRPLQPLM